jgi:UDP-3-O-acyl-N-acetylglucosamine deacetylase
MNLKIVAASKNQTTIGRAVALKGFSSTDFKDCRACLLPGAIDQGIVFRIGGQVIPATIAHVRHGLGEHATVLEKNGIKIRSVAHLLSAIYGLGLDNLVIELEGDSVPLTDYSAKPFVHVLTAAGMEELDAPRNVAKVTKTMRFERPDGAFAIIKPARSLKLLAETVTDFPPPIGLQCCRFAEGRTDYAEEIAWARSFMRSPLDEAGDKWARVRAKFPVLPEDPTVSPLIVYDRNGYLTRLSDPEEPGRHKMLDLLGDLALLGRRLAAEVRIYKPSHEFTAEIVAALAEELA